MEKEYGPPRFHKIVNEKVNEEKKNFYQFLCQNLNSTICCKTTLFFNQVLEAVIMPSH